jgi:hypothetical protein
MSENEAQDQAQPQGEAPQMPAQTGSPNDILAKARAKAAGGQPQSLRMPPELDKFPGNPAPSQPAGPEKEPQRKVYPRYRLPVAPCTVDFDGERRTFADGVVQASNDREQEILDAMVRVGNIYPMEVPKSKFADQPSPPVAE